MLSLLIFLGFLGISALIFIFIAWNLSGKPEDDFKTYLKVRYRQFREQRKAAQEEASGGLKIIRSRELPEASDLKKEPSSQEELSKAEEIERLNRLYGES